MVFAVALPWYLLAGRQGALLLGGVLAAYGVARTAFLSLGGHASDRWSPWTVMMAADSVRAVAVALVALVAATGTPDARLLIPAAALLGAGAGLFLPGSFAIIPALLPAPDLKAGNALSSGANQLIALLGPAIGGLLVAAYGPTPAFMVDAVSFLVSAGTLVGIRTISRSDQDRRHGPGPARRPRADVGVADADLIPAAEKPLTIRRMLSSSRVLQTLLLLSLAANLGAGGMSEVALPALARGPFGAGAGSYGGLIAATGAGAFVGVLAAARIRFPRRPALVCSGAFLGQAVLVAAVPHLGGLIPAAGALAAFGLLNGFANVLMVTAVQQWAPAELLGRIMSLVLLTSFGSFPVSVLLGGWLVHLYGPSLFFLLDAAVLAMAVTVALTQRLWREFGIPPSDGNTGFAPSPPAGPASDMASA